MDLTTLATDAAAEHQRQQESAMRRHREQERLNSRTATRRLFYVHLGIEVAEQDVLDCPNIWHGTAGVVVDGHRLLLAATTDRDETYLRPWYLCPDGEWALLESKRISDLPSLGRVLGATRLGFSGRDPWWESGRLVAYYPGRGCAVHWRDSRDVDPPEFLAGT